MDHDCVHARCMVSIYDPLCLSAFLTILWQLHTIINDKHAAILHCSQQSALYNTLLYPIFYTLHVCNLTQVTKHTFG